MIDLTKITETPLNTVPFSWREIGDLFLPQDAAALAKTYPHDHFKTIEAYGGEKDYFYDARALISMGADSVTNAEDLSESWGRLARDLLAPEYRAAVSALSGMDLSLSPMEVNVYHYGPRGLLGPHRDLPEKRVVHVFYFNESWNRADGGCLAILNSSDPDDVVTVVEPIVGNSALFVRCENSWHEVQRVVDGCRQSRRSMVATFYDPGSVSSMWPPGDTAPLHQYVPA